MSGYTWVPTTSSDMRSTQSARFPPASDGDADISTAVFPRSGMGFARVTQSIAFFSTAGTE